MIIYYNKIKILKNKQQAYKKITKSNLVKKVKKLKLRI